MNRERISKLFLTCVLVVTVLTMVRTLLPSRAKLSLSPAYLSQMDLLYSSKQKWPQTYYRYYNNHTKPDARYDIELNRFAFQMRPVAVYDTSREKMVQVKQFQGRLTNISPFDYEVYMKVRFLDKKGRLVQECGLYEENLAGSSNAGYRGWTPAQFIWGNPVRFEIVEIRAKGRPQTWQKDIFTLLFLGLGIAFAHLCLAAWMHPRGWEWRLLNGVRRTS